MVGGGDIRAGVELSTSSYHRTKMRAKEAAGPCFLWCCDLTLQVQTDPKNEGGKRKSVCRKTFHHSQRLDVVVGCDSVGLRLLPCAM